MDVQLALGRQNFDIYQDLDAYMRSTRTIDEENAIKKLSAHLACEDPEVLELADVTDRPDAAFVFRGATIACECRVLGPESVFELHGVKTTDQGFCFVFLPIEPHIWIRDALKAKSPLIPQYKKRCNASEAWLVLHELQGISQRLVSFRAPEILDVFKMGAFQTDHNFDRIYVLTGEEDPVCIFNADKSSIEEREKYTKMRIQQIPVQLKIFGLLTTSSDQNYPPTITANLNTPTRRILLQPLDQEFEVDYSDVESYSFEDAWPTVATRRS